MKTITQVSGKTFKMGRNRPVVQCPRLSLKNYLMRSGLPAPPASVSYSPAAAPELANLYGNDVLGDCVIACMGHTEGVFTGNAGDPLMLGNEQIIVLYSDIGGYVPGDPSTDNGCDIQTALNWWEFKGLGNGKHKIAGVLNVSPSDEQEIRLALWLFENLVFGFELPDAWVNPMPSASGFVWAVAGNPDPANGHCVAGVGYDSAGVTIATWGMLGLITNAAIAQYCAAAASGEFYAVISQDAIARATLKAPNEFDWTQLQADFQALKG